MSVKRYDLDGNADGYFDDPFMKVREKGKFVLHSDYAALQARHNALREAVALMLAALDSDKDDAMAEYFEARAEVDRLIASEPSANCKGEG